MIFELGKIIWVSVRVSGLATLIAGLLAVPLALLLSSIEFKGKKMIVLVNQTLMATPTVVIGLVLYFLLNRSGPLGRFGLLFTPTAMTIGEIILILPIILGFSYSALAQIDKRVRLSALSLGASPPQAGMMTLQEAKFPLIIAVLAGFARAISEVGIALMVGGNIKDYTRNITTTIALESSKGEFELALILGLILLLLTLGVNFLVNFSLRGSD